MTEQLNENQNIEKNIPHEYKELFQNTTLESLSLILIDLLEMTKRQVENNLVTAALLNAYGEVLVTNNLTTQEDFEPILAKHMRESEKLFNENLEQFLNESEDNSEQPTEQIPE